MDIDALRIVLRPSRSETGERGVARCDPLRAYYLDPDNLRDTDAAAVQRPDRDASRRTRTP